jgi:cytochrome c556
MDPSDLRAGLAEHLSGSAPLDAETFNAACFMLSRSLDEIDFSVPEAKPLVRHLLRIAGRVLIDTGTSSASPDVWPNTEEMVLQWIDEALADLGYAVTPREESGHGE